MSNLQTATTILSQLGGRRFIAMTGAKNFVGDASTLMFSVPAGKVNKVRVTLDASDTYTVEFYKVRGVDVAKRASHSGVYFDQLRAIFEAETGLRTSL
jgi:hypothetical protein